jgi:hypothetical protein
MRLTGLQATLLGIAAGFAVLVALYVALAA